jgi:uncharacterized protein YcfJ
MKMRVAVPLLLGALAAPAFASDYTDSAPVISSVPIYRTVVEPQQQCWTESVTRYEEHRTAGGVILGGITGGLIGNTIGRGNGRAASTVVGAMIGAVVGDHIANRDNTPVAVTRPMQRCQTVENQRQVVTGYQVTYNYNGRNTTVVMPYDPGARVPIDVGVTASAPQPVYIGPPVARITYVQRRAPVWEQKPYRRPRYDRDWDHR